MIIFSHLSFDTLFSYTLLCSLPHLLNHSIPPSLPLSLTHSLTPSYFTLSQETIRRAIEFGVEVKMITGDHLLIAVETAKLLNLGDTVYGTDVVEPLIRTAEGRQKR